MSTIPLAKHRVIAATIIAPLVPPLIMAITFLATDGYIGEGVIHLGLLAIFGLWTLLLGIPTTWFYRKKGWDAWWMFFAGGILLGTVTAWIAYPIVLVLYVVDGLTEYTISFLEWQIIVVGMGSISGTIATAAWCLLYAGSKRTHMPSSSTRKKTSPPPLIPQRDPHR